LPKRDFARAVLARCAVRAREEQRDARLSQKAAERSGHVELGDFVEGSE
jgi:hypothetical protein